VLPGIAEEPESSFSMLADGEAAQLSPKQMQDQSLLNSISLLHPHNSLHPETPEQKKIDNISPNNLQEKEQQEEVEGSLQSVSYIQLDRSANRKLRESIEKNYQTWCGDNKNTYSSRTNKNTSPINRSSTHTACTQTENEDAFTPYPSGSTPSTVPISNNTPAATYSNVYSNSMRTPAAPTSAQPALPVGGLYALILDLQQNPVLVPVQSHTNVNNSSATINNVNSIGSGGFNRENIPRSQSPPTQFEPGKSSTGIWNSPRRSFSRLESAALRSTTNFDERLNILEEEERKNKYARDFQQVCDQFYRSTSYPAQSPIQSTYARTSSAHDNAGFTTTTPIRPFTATPSPSSPVSATKRGKFSSSDSEFWRERFQKQNIQAMALLRSPVLSNL
jgi:hypothetical protein